MREIRLTNFVPLGKPAFDSLRELEEKSLPPLAPNTSKSDRRRRREESEPARLAIAPDMRKQKTFLGGTLEKGITFGIPGLEHKQACYLYASRMGYLEAHDSVQDKIIGRD